MMARTDKTSKNVLVLDTSAFVAGFDPFSVKEEQYVTPMVREEFFKGSLSLTRLKTAIDSGRIKVRSPEKEFLEAVKKTATIIGDKHVLSETDLQILALALNLKADGFDIVIVTDDYSIQNVASKMGIQFSSLTTFGIRHVFEWVRYCPACHKKFPKDYKFKNCDACNTELKRKPTLDSKNYRG